MHIYNLLEKFRLITVYSFHLPYLGSLTKTPPRIALKSSGKDPKDSKIISITNIQRSRRSQDKKTSRIRGCTTLQISIKPQSLRTKRKFLTLPQSSLYFKRLTREAQKINAGQMGKYVQFIAVVEVSRNLAAAY